ncbi:hypothetical protein OH492_22820 [Vibrio chagasii]|nr:hypothetical protein [Vibrio chagasii]
MRISSPDELESGLEKALAMKDRLVFVDISVDDTENVYTQCRLRARRITCGYKTERT